MITLHWWQLWLMLSIAVGIGLALFHGFSKMLNISGCEPEEMATTVLSVPGAQPR